MDSISKKSRKDFCNLFSEDNDHGPIPSSDSKTKQKTTLIPEDKKISKKHKSIIEIITRLIDFY